MAAGPYFDEAFWNGASLSANGTISETLHGFGADTLAVQVKSSNTYSIDVEWLDGDGNVIRDEQDALGGTLSGGTWNRQDFTAWSAHVKVEVNEDSGADSTVDGTMHFRG